MADIIAIDAEATGTEKPTYWQTIFTRYAQLNEERYFLVASGQGRVLGFIAGRVRSWEFGAPPSGWVVAINLARNKREAGLGTALLDRLCATFQTDGITKLRTSVARRDTVILSFFRSQGMTAAPYVELEMDLTP